MDPAPGPVGPRGAVLLGSGLAIELVGAVLLVWQEQDIYTVNSSITLPAWGSMLLGIGLVAIGYARLLRSVGGRPAVSLAVAGAAGGAVLASAALAWQITYGLTPSGEFALEVDAAVPLFFVGVAAVTSGCRSLGRTGAAMGGGAARPMSPEAIPPIAVTGPSAAVFAAGAVLLVALVAGAGWLSSQAAGVSSLYQFVALELAVGGAWLLLSGVSSLLDLVPIRRLEGARRLATVGGFLVLVGGAVGAWRTAPLVYGLTEVLVGGACLAGLGLLLLGRSKHPKIA